MESPKPCRPSPNPLLSLSAFIHQNCLRFGAELAGRIEETKRFAGALAGNLPAVLKAADLKNGFNGVPVFQEDIENELGKVSRASRGPGVSQNILVSEKDSGWEDLIFIPPGKSFSQHIQDVSKK
ncbi:hypothetical protein L484_006334 [Morus notabilis]|uniref:Uncharacterized protein n=1 Tax=Morus notabilis TaxID=981085 RepID=W9SPA6_9ROSA|nr:hypothetical protein L484_006334 [Morus notabilis]